MTEKKTWLLITFYTTAGAMAMEKHCREQGIPGRLIPVPRSITADCGLAWRTEPSQRAAMSELLARADVAGCYEMEL